MSDPSGFLDGKRICVTGGGGFLGSYVIERLKQQGATDIFVPRKADYDLVDGAAVRRLLSDVQPQVVLHLAANVGGIGANRAHPAEFFYDNLMMGVQLLHESWKQGVEKFVAVGTVCSYPKFTPVPFKEVDFWGGYPEETNAPYGLAKKMLLVQSQSYRHQYGFNSIYLIPVNLYGPEDNFDLETSHVLPALLRKTHDARRGAGKRTLEIWGAGTARREFLHIDDCADALVYLMAVYSAAAHINVGSGAEVTIEELARLIMRVVGLDGVIEKDLARPGGTPRKLMDSARLNALGWSASIPLEDGIRMTYADAPFRALTP